MNTLTNLTLFTVLLLSSCNKEASAPLKEESTPEERVYLVKEYTNSFGTTSRWYRLKGGQYGINWAVITYKKDQSLGLELSYFNKKSKQGGHKDFTSQVEHHKAILGHIFNKYSRDMLLWVRTPGLRVLNPSEAWNDKLSDLAARNKDWIDYTKNYPNHLSGKSSNAIMREELNSNLHIIKDFLGLFKPISSLEVSAVEKVMTKKKSTQTVFFDAAIYTYTATGKEFK